MRRFSERLAIGGVLLFMTACSEPPTKEHDQAVASIAAARTAGAAAYASEDLSAADASLKRYDDLVAQGDFKQALSAALDARDHGYEAAKTSANAQQALQTQANQLLAGLDADLKTADSLIASVPRSSARADKLRLTRKATMTAMQDARTQLSNGELTKAVKRLVSATAALKRDIAALQPAPTKSKK